MEVMNEFAQNSSTDIQQYAASNEVTIDVAASEAWYTQDTDGDSEPPLTVTVAQTDNYETSHEYVVTVTPPGSRGCFTIPESGPPTVRPC
jgi:hypothetical protein